MIKQPNDENNIMRFSDAPISHEDLHPTILEYVTGEEQDGTVYDYDINTERIRMFYEGHDGPIGGNKGYEIDLKEYVITNRPFDYFDNYYSTGVIYSKGKIIKKGE